MLVILYKYYVTGHYPSSCFHLKHRPVYISKHNVSETGFSLRLQVNVFSWAQSMELVSIFGDRAPSIELVPIFGDMD
jgi:hypothetical protein